MNSTFRAFWLAPVTRKILGYSMFLRPELRWCLVSRHFRKTKFERLVKQSTKQIPRKWGTLACQCWLEGIKKMIFMLNLQQNRKNALDKTPEMFVNCKQSSYWLTVLIYKSHFFHFYPTDLVNTKTTIPSRLVNNYRYIPRPSASSCCSTTIHLPLRG